jgi:hypothetical protein
MEIILIPDEIKDIGMKIYKVIFDKNREIEIEGVNYKIDKFSSGVRYIDYFGYRFIEQNRNKKSEWGKKAREGHKIMWIIKGRRYMARIMDGVFLDLKTDKE